MPLKIQGTPKGILSAFGIIGGPANIADLEQRVLPVVDVKPHYAAGAFEVAFNIVAGVTAAGSSVQIVVPAGEYWEVWAVEGTVVGLAVGELLTFSVGLSDHVGGNVVTLFGTDGGPVLSQTIGDAIRLGSPLPQPLILAGGNLINGQINFATPVGVDLHIAALIRRLTA